MTDAATVLGPGEGEEVSPGVVLKATTETTGGSLYLAETTIPPGFPGPPPHVHDTLHDMFYVLEGTLTLRIGDDTLQAGPGTFACAPPGGVHTFSNTSDAPVRMLNLSTPAGFEHYMRELGGLLRSGDVTPAAIGEIASRFDFRAVE
jgi:quercetin dioxygenase-like cupin family protein